MIVERITGFFKVGKLEEATALVAAELKRNKPPHGCRIYTPDIGVPHDRACTEWEFTDMNEREQFWRNWLAQPEAQAFFEKYQPLLESGELHEIWTLISG